MGPSLFQWKLEAAQSELEITTSEEVLAQETKWLVASEQKYRMDRTVSKVICYNKLRNQTKKKRLCCKTTTI
jgi:hypothetical protein